VAGVQIGEAAAGDGVVEIEELAAEDLADEGERDGDARLGPDLVGGRREVGVARRPGGGALQAAVVAELVDADVQREVDGHRRGRQRQGGGRGGESQAGGEGGHVGSPASSSMSGP
jgi:hypothetical protein